MAVESFEVPAARVPYDAAARVALTLGHRSFGTGQMPTLRWYRHGRPPIGMDWRTLDLVEPKVSGWYNLATHTIWVAADLDLAEVIRTVGHELGHLRPEIRSLEKGSDEAESACEHWAERLLSTYCLEPGVSLAGL